MKSKKILKKLLSTLLCFTTLTFSVGLLNVHSQNLICELIDGTLQNCVPFSAKNLEKYSNVSHANCGDDGFCRFFDKTNKFIGTNSNESYDKLTQKSPGLIVRMISGMANCVSKAFASVSPYILMGLGFSVINKAMEYSQKALNKYEQFKNELTIKKEAVANPIEAINKLDYYLKDVKGQDEALHEVRKFILNLVDERSQKINGNSNQKGTHNILYLVGPSGVGKSFTAENLVKALNGPEAEPFVFEPSNLVSGSKIFGVISKKMLKGEINQYSVVVKQLVENPYTVFIFNEVDKYDKKGEKVYLKELEETFRTIIDHGYIYINGEKIDCSKAIFIMTSNADLKSIKGQPIEDDSTGSLTSTEHDKSFLNRIKTVEFKNLNTEAYKKIAKPIFKALQQRYLDEYNVLVTFEDDLLNGVAKLVEQRNQGARPIQDFIDAISSKLLNEVILPGANDKSYSGKIINISLDNNSEFKLTESDNYKKALMLAVERLKQSYLSQHNIKINISEQTIDNISSLLKEFQQGNPQKNPPIALIIDSLGNKIYEDIILSENSKKSFGQKFLEKFGASKNPSYFGKTYNVEFNNRGWEINEGNISQEKRSNENQQVPNLSAEVEEN